MRTTKRIFGRDVQFRLERNSWSWEMGVEFLPRFQIMYLSGLEIQDELKMPGFWNIEFSWIKFSFTICIDDKENA